MLNTTERPATSTSPPPHQQLDRMITGYWLSQAIYAAAKLGVADHLKDGPRPVDDLAARTSANPDALYRLLRALASVGIFTESAGRRFGLTPMADLLRSDAPGSKRALALMSGDEQFRAWAEIEHTMRTGEVAFQKVFGEPVFDYLGKHPEKARIFDAAMVGVHGREADAVLDVYDFSRFGVVADIGGGNGSQLTGLLRRHAAARGILFDLPHVIDAARGGITAAGLADRCTLVAGSFFDAVPAGANCYVLRHIIHDWYDEDALTILRSCHRAMKPDGTLVIVESVIPPGNEPHFGKLLDLVMMMIPGGKERTEDEYRTLLAEAGFDLTRIVPTDADVSVVEGKKR